MKIKDKIKSYSFWVSLASAVILILKVLGARFGFTVDEGMISDLFTAMCSILVLLGIIVVPGSTQQKSSSDSLSDFPDTNDFNIKNSLNTNIVNAETIKECSSDEQETTLSNLTSENNELESNSESFSAPILDFETNEKYCEYNNSDDGLIYNDAVTEINSSNQNSCETIYNESSENATIINKQDDYITSNTGDCINQCNDLDDVIITNNVLDNNNEKPDLVLNLKKSLEQERQNFSGNIEKYILELEKEIENIRNNLQ